MKKKILLFAGSMLFSLLLIELVLRLMVKPSQTSYGEILGRQLPPLDVIPPHILAEGSTEFKDAESEVPLIVDGKTITESDLWGVKREDEIVGFTAKENSVSSNGWWQTNNLGARSSEPISTEKLPGRERILFFGDSFAACCGVPQDETFYFYLNETAESVEAVNFAMTGYSIGQAYLRFTTLKDKLEFDRVFLILAPYADLWRDINVNRYLGEGWVGWELKMMPRFVLENGELTLVPSPYPTIQDLLDDHNSSINPAWKDHLKQYDAFYSECLHEEHFIFDMLITFKLLKYKYCNSFAKLDRNRLMDTDSEAMAIIKAIIDKMSREVASEGAEFALIILPEMMEIEKYSSDPDFRKSWAEMVSFLCSDKITCYDLMDDFKRVPPDALDLAYENHHYGPATNKLIAEFILKRAIDNTSDADIMPKDPAEK